MSTQFIISTFSKHGHLIGRVIWESHKPIGLGYPFKVILEKCQSGIRVWDLKGSGLEKDTPKEYSDNGLSDRTFPFGKESKFTVIPARYSQVAQNWFSRHVDAEKLGADSEEKVFQKVLFGSLGGMGVLLLSAVILSMFIKPSEELVPAQFAKVIMTPPRTSGSEGARARANQEKEKGARAVNLVQAFKSTEVQKSTLNLLRAGALTLLAKSTFLPDVKSRARVNAVFEPTKTGKSAVSLAPLLASNSMNVGVMGGTAAGGSGTSVGYGKGGPASVQGQGNSLTGKPLV